MSIILWQCCIVFHHLFLCCSFLAPPPRARTRGLLLSLLLLSFQLLPAAMQDLTFIASSNPVSKILFCFTFILKFLINNQCVNFCVPTLHCFSPFISLLQLPCASKSKSKNKLSPAPLHHPLPSIQWMKCSPMRRAFLSSLLSTL